MTLIIPNYSPVIAAEACTGLGEHDQGATFKIMVWKLHMQNLSSDALVVGSWAMRAAVVPVKQNSDRNRRRKSMQAVA